MIIDPRKSYILDASAGSGKTFQLALRFLSLVAAGSSPESILTITFTRKAALEMKQRILSFAVKLNQDESFRKLFISLYPQDLQMTGPVLKMVSRKVVDSASRLRIMTMDSLFFEWLQMYQYDILKDHFIYDFEVLSGAQTQAIQDEAWKKTLEKLLETSHSVIDEMMKNVFQKRGFFELRNLIESLMRFDHHLFQCLHEGRPLLNPFDLPEVDVDADQLGVWHQQLCDVASKALYARLEKCSAKNLAVDYQKNGLYTLSKESLSGTFFRKKFRDTHSDLCESLESYLQSYFRRDLLQKLNQRARLLEVFYSYFQEEFSHLKLESGQIEFGDFVKYAKNLWGSSSSNISQFFIMERTKHLLIDEFQDTSRLQWSVFEPMVQELFAGLGSDNDLASVFIVGDVKQSIYGFREAEPRMMEEIKKDIPLFESLSMSESFRTSPLCLSFINQVFSTLDLGMQDSFPEHKTSPLVLKEVQHGSVHIEELEVEGLSKDEKYQLEASKIASKISQMVSNPKFQHFDEDIDTYRELVPSDFLVLYRSATHTSFLEDALFSESLEVSKDIGKYFFDDLFVESKIKQKETEMVMVSGAAVLIDKHSPYLKPYEAIEESINQTSPYQPYTLLSQLNSLEEYPEGLRENQTISNKDSVRMMSIHQSKGLEAAVVIIYGSSEPWFKQDHYWRKDKEHLLHYVGTKPEQPAQMPSIKELHSQSRANSIEESYRLLYVALTRTQNHIVAFGYELKDGLFSCLQDSFKLKQDWYETPDKSSKKAKIKSVHAPIKNLKPNKTRTFESTVKHLLPHRFVQASEQKSLLNKQSSLDLGNTVHLALELHLKNKLNIEDSIEKAIKILQLETNSAISISSTKMLQTLVASNLWLELMATAQKVDCELPFTFLDKNSLMRGKIDLLLHLADGSIHIIDYKTAHSGESDKQKLKLLIHEQGIHLQLNSYKKAIESLYESKNIMLSVLHVPSCQLIELQNTGDIR